MIILQNVITSHHRKSGKSKCYRARFRDHTNPVPSRRGFNNTTCTRENEISFNMVLILLSRFFKAVFHSNRIAAHLVVSEKENMLKAQGMD